MKVIDRFFEVLGHSIHVRVEPPAFKKDVHTIAKLINEDKYDEAFNLLIAAQSKWGHDDYELLRLNSAIHFMTHPVDHST